MESNEERFLVIMQTDSLNGLVLEIVWCTASSAKYLNNIHDFKDWDKCNAMMCLPVHFRLYSCHPSRV
jgi:hypothetical protein